MTVTIKPIGPFRPGGEVEVKAESTGSATGWKWQVSTDRTNFTDLSSTKNSLTFKTDDYAHKTLKAIATLQAGGTDEGTLAVTLAAADEPAGDGAQESAEPPAVWHAGFALVVGVIVAVVLVLFLLTTSIRSAMLGLDAVAYAKLDGRAEVAAAVIGPIILIGVTVTLVGVWMVAVEWRGRFKAVPAKVDGKVQGKGGVEDVTTLVATLGKLRGATLMLLAGVTILLCAAWVTSSAANATPTPSTTTTTTTPPT